MLENGSQRQRTLTLQMGQLQRHGFQGGASRMDCPEYADANLKVISNVTTRESYRPLIPLRINTRCALNMPQRNPQTLITKPTQAGTL